MTEDEFDALMRARSYGTKDATRAEDQIRHGMTLLTTLGTALWGTSEGDAQRQLLKSHPEIPAGFDLADFRELLRVTAQTVSAFADTHKGIGLSHLVPWSRTIVAGTQKFTLWEARCEIVRRAIDYLEER
ncbi:MAG TPA: hypothetical protein VKH81_11240 [Candidatus Angelobacter sp.]|nr:hypothetical protein [Candidatus Angelobacter sp.]